MKEPFIPNCFYRISVKALILDEKKRFLLTKEDNGYWELPGGGLDFGEKPRDCLAREIKEEMGLTTTFIAEHPTYFVTAQHLTNKHWFANIIYEVKVADLEITPSDECVEVRFFTNEEAAEEKLFSNVKEFIRAFDAHRM